jgi:copper chaperone
MYPGNHFCMIAGKSRAMPLILMTKTTLFEVQDMALALKVPGMTSEDVAKTIVDTIKTTEPDAKIDVDLNTQTITIEAAASEETMKQLIVASGYLIE